MRFVFLASFGIWIAVFTNSHKATADDATPALVVVVSVNQWSYDYFDRFAENFQAGGLVRRCQQNGVWFSNCLHGHAFTTTGPGHAVQVTGCYSDRHGIVGNDWYVRGEERLVYCVDDAGVALIGGVEDDRAVSPRRLLADTLGDQLKLATRGRSKVFSVAMKDRAAVLMAGHQGDAAFWLSKSGNWITSDYYVDVLPGYIRQLNENRTIHRYENRLWDLRLAADQYRHGVPEDSFDEKPTNGMSASFPHRVPAADDQDFVPVLTCTPFGNEYTLNAASQVLVNEQLGQDEYPDLLAVNLSTNDYVGHRYGPYSLEVEDLTYWTDDHLGAFARQIDDHMKDRNEVMFVTADHGVAPIPERAARWRLPAARAPFGQADEGTGNFSALQHQSEAYLNQTLEAVDETPLIEAFFGTSIYLNNAHPLVQIDGGAAIARRARDWIVLHKAVATAVYPARVDGRRRRTTE